MNEKEVKLELHAMCLEWAEKRILQAQAAMQMTQAAANQETKSSAGDKYETGRAMMHQEQEKNARQLMESMKIKKVLDQLDPAKECEEVGHGALLLTNNGHFYVAVGIGNIEMEGKDFMVISPVSPLARQLTGMKAGQEASFNGRKYKIEKLV